MAEVTPGDIHRAVESELRHALMQRIANADGYSHKRDTNACDTQMVISKRDVCVIITIHTEWTMETDVERQLETK